MLVRLTDDTKDLSEAVHLWLYNSRISVLHSPRAAMVSAGPTVAFWHARRLTANHTLSIWMGHAALSEAESL
jgi:hypothetical protein